MSAWPAEPPKIPDRSELEIVLRKSGTKAEAPRPTSADHKKSCHVESSVRESAKLMLPPSRPAAAISPITERCDISLSPWHNCSCGCFRRLPQLGRVQFVVAIIGSGGNWYRQIVRDTPADEAARLSERLGVVRIVLPREAFEI